MMQLRQTNLVAFPIVFALLFLVGTTGCYAQDTLIYEPANWADAPGEDLVWKTEWDRIEFRTFRLVIEDDRSTSFRINFEVTNASEHPVRLYASANLKTGTRLFTGEIIRLFSPDGLVVQPEEYAEFAAVFDIKTPLRLSLRGEAAMTFKAAGRGDAATDLNLVFERVED